MVPVVQGHYKLLMGNDGQISMSRIDDQLSTFGSQWREWQCSRNEVMKSVEVVCTVDSQDKLFSMVSSSVVACRWHRYRYIEIRERCSVIDCQIIGRNMVHPCWLHSVPLLLCSLALSSHLLLSYMASSQKFAVDNKAIT
jgi:hypothetical protein